jgi:hypothetical protein
MFMCRNDESRSLEGVYFIPQLATNIVSIGQLDEVHYKIDIDTSVMKIWEPRGLLLLRVKREANHMYLLHIMLMQSPCFMVHRRGDKELVGCPPVIGQVEQLCEVCHAEKQQCTTFPTKAEYRVRRCLDLVDGDFCGPIAPVMPRGNRYFLLLVDDLNRYMRVATIPSKDCAATAIKEIQA